MLPFTLLLLCGIYLSVKSRFSQITRFPDSIRFMAKALHSKKQGEGINSYQAACTALSATVGTGNIAGIAGALSIGGAGAIFWMWVSGVAGMCVKAAEIILAVSYREKRDGAVMGGPMYYIKKGLPKALKPVAAAFCIASVPAVFCSGNITQANAAVLSLGGGRTVKIVAGIIFTLLTYAAITGGIKRIGVITEKIVPVMSVLYVILSLSTVILNIDFLPQAFKMIIEGAFSPKAVTGGAVGSVMTAALIGAQRGVFSNEAGLGTSAMAHAAAYDADPKTQGLFGIFEVFVDTILLCTLTALAVLCSGVTITYGTASSSELVVSALSQVFGNLAAPIISVMLCLFAFSSIIGWAVYGSICVGFLFGKKGEKIFLKLYPLGCLAGALANVKLAWDLSAFFNGIMMCINLPSIIFLSSNAIKYLKKEENHNVSGKNNGFKQYFRGRSGGADNKRC